MEKDNENSENPKQEVPETSPLDQFISDVQQLPFHVHFLTRQDYERKFFCEDYSRLHKQAEEKKNKNK